MKKTLLLIALLISSFTFAQDYFFNGSVDSDPSNPANWDASNMPPNIGTGTINAGEAVNIIGSATFDAPSSLSLLGTIINEGNFALPSGGYLYMQDGVLTNKGTGIMTLSGMIDGFGISTITNSENGTLSFIGVDIFGFPGTIFNINNSDSGQLDIDNATSIFLAAGSSFTNQNNAIINNSGVIVLDSADFTNTGTAILNNLTNSSLNIYSSAVFDNLSNATISNTDANIIVNSSTLNNGAIINNFSNTNIEIKSNATVYNYGFISSNNSTIIDIETGSGFANDSGLISNHDAVIMTFNNSNFNNLNSGVVNNYGTTAFRFLSSAVGYTNDTSSINNYDTSSFFISVASFNNQGSAIISNYQSSIMTINQSNFQNLTNSTLICTNSSTLVISGGGTLNNNNSAIIYNQDNAHLTLNAGSIINNLGSASFFNNDSATMTINYQFNNNDIATFTNNSTFNTIASMNNYGTISGSNTSHTSAISNYGTFSPGNSPGKYIVDTFINNVSGIVNIEIEGLGNLANAGITYDTIEVSGNKGLSGGTLNVTLPTGYDPAVGEEFTIFTSATGAGTFYTVNFPTLTDKEFVISYTNTEVKLTVQSTLGLDDLDIDKLSIYPNPADSQVSINGIKETTQVDIFSITGKKVRTETLTNYNNTLNISKLASGMYIFRIKNKNYKIIKQ